MSIYRIEYSTLIKEIGCYPQVQEGIYPISTDDPDFSGQLWFEKADLPRVVFPKLILAKKAKLTDLLSCVIMGTSFKLVISTKLKEVLEDSLHREMQFIPATVIVKGEENRDYWFTNHYNLAQDLIDFPQCEICKSEWVHKRTMLKSISIDSFESYLEIEKGIKPPSGLRIKNLVLKEPIHEEFFTLRRVAGGVGHYVSEALKQRIESAGCTGMRFMGINEPL